MALGTSKSNGEENWGPQCLPYIRPQGLHAKLCRTQKKSLEVHLACWNLASNEDTVNGEWPPLRFGSLFGGDVMTT